MTKREEMLMKRISELKNEKEKMKKTLEIICSHLVFGVDEIFDIKYIEMEKVYDRDYDFAEFKKAVEEYK